MFKKFVKILVLIIFISFIIPVNTPAAATYRGIDVSHWQGDIDWAKVAGDGIEFAIVKATEGTTLVDPKLVQNVTNAKANNIPVGAYHFARFTNVNQAIAEADFFLNTISGLSLTYAVALDLEIRDGAETMAQAANAFINKVRDAGHVVLLYANENFFLTFMNQSYINNAFFWVAKYSTVAPRVHADMWQYTSSGRVNGISGNVDMNIAYLDFRTESGSSNGNGGPSNGNETNNTVTNNTIVDNTVVNNTIESNNIVTNNSLSNNVILEPIDENIGLLMVWVFFALFILIPCLVFFRYRRL